MTTLKWIQKGNTGCTFATFFSKIPEKIGWKFYTPDEWLARNLFQIEDAHIVSICFPDDWRIDDIRNWTSKSNFYIETQDIGFINSSGKRIVVEGLRLPLKQGMAWVQYFGPDSHVPTRQAPQPMLLYCNKTGISYYWKVGFNGILHLAHAWKEGLLTKKKADTMWDRAHKQTKKKVGHELGLKEAAKTTWLR